MHGPPCREQHQSEAGLSSSHEPHGVFFADSLRDFSRRLFKASRARSLPSAPSRSHGEAENTSGSDSVDSGPGSLYTQSPVTLPSVGTTASAHAALRLSLRLDKGGAGSHSGGRRRARDVGGLCGTLTSSLHWLLSPTGRNKRDMAPEGLGTR